MIGSRETVCGSLVNVFSHFFIQRNGDTSYVVIIDMHVCTRAHDVDSNLSGSGTKQKGIHRQTGRQTDG